MSKLSRNRLNSYQIENIRKEGLAPLVDELRESPRLSHSAKGSNPRPQAATARLGGEFMDGSDFWDPERNLWKVLRDMTHRKILEENERKMKRHPPPPPGFHAIRGK